MVELNEIIEGSKEAKTGLAAMNEEMAKGPSLLGKLAESAGVSFDALIEGAGSSANAFAGIGLVIEPIFNVLDKNRKIFGELGDAGKQGANSIGDSFGAAAPLLTKFSNALPVGILSTLGKGVVDVSARMAQSADKTRALEAGLLRTAAATGMLNDFLDTSGENFGQISNKTATYVSLLNDTANATGTTSTKVAEFADQLKAVPGALDTSVYIDGMNSMHMLSASMKLAAGTGMEYKDVVSKLGEAYGLFNLEGEAALDYTNRISVAANALKIPLDSVSKFTADAAQQFKFFGDNTEGALKVLGGFDKAMEGSKLGYQTIQELATGALGKIKEMGIAQKALLSQQTGGAGGLQGAFQIEAEIREGGIASVMGRVEDALREQMGGNLVTLDQARQSQEASAQMMRQVAFLTQGPTAIASTTDQATQIVDAMVKGNLTALEDVMASPQDNLAKSIDVGNEFQKMQSSGITRMANAMDNALMMQSLELRALDKLAFGSDSPLAKELRQSMVDAMSKGAEAKVVTGDIGAGAKTTTDALTSVADDAKGAMNMARKGMAETVDIMDKKSGGAIDRVAQKLGTSTEEIRRKMLGAGLPTTPPAVDIRNQIAVDTGAQERERVSGALRLSGLTPPPTLAGAGAEIDKTGKRVANEQPQQVELTINLKQDGGNAISEKKVKFLLDKNNKDGNKKALDWTYNGVNLSD